MFRVLLILTLCGSLPVCGFVVNRAFAATSSHFLAANVAQLNKKQPDISLLLADKMHLSKSYNATVVNCRSYGLYAKLDDFGIEGLLPMAKLHQFDPQTSIQDSFP